jgi:hypothetical protein
MKPRWKAAESIALEKKPRGWIIQADETAEGLVLQWPLNSSLLTNLSIGWGRVFLPIWLCGWAAGLIAVSYGLLDGRFPPVVLIWLAFWTVGGAWAIFTCWALYKPRRPEAIILADDWFGYDPGRTPPPMYGWGYSFSKVWHFVFDPPKRIFVNKQDLAKFELGRLGERQRLTFENDIETVEIGQCLQESERRWLFSVLEHWRKGTKIRNLDDVALLDESIRDVDGVSRTRQNLDNNIQR